MEKIIMEENPQDPVDSLESETPIKNLKEGLKGEANKEEKPIISDNLELIISKGKSYKIQLVYTLFGRKFYKTPLRFINKNIKLYDNFDNIIPHDIRTYNQQPYSHEVKTFFNQNNLGILKGDMNIVMAKIYPKYEHFVDFSSNNDIYITCSEKFEPEYITWCEFGVVRRIKREDKIEDIPLLVKN